MNIDINQASLPRSPLPTFQQRFYHECIDGSAIAPSLYNAAVEIVEDTGFWEPNRALNQRVSIQWQTHKPHAYGAIAFFKQESGECWQGKPENPRVDGKGKTVKYEKPVESGADAYLPPVNIQTRQAIQQNYPDLTVPLEGSFWDWVVSIPSAPITFTEGGKKALALLTQGTIAIALVGVNGGYRKLESGARALIADVERFTVPGRQITLAFDQDAAPKTRRRVQVALSRFGALLKASGADVAIAEWASSNGKGVDDLIAAHGVEAWESALSNRLTLDEWNIWNRLENRLNIPAHVPTNVSDLSKIDIAEIPSTGIIAIAGGKGTGKTKWLAHQITAERGAIALGHRIALMRNLCDRLGLDYRGDVQKINTQGHHQGGVYRIGIGACVDGLLSIDPEKWHGQDLIIDEVVQVVRHLLTSKTCAQEGKRPALLARFRALIQNAGRVIVADADLDGPTLHYLESLRDDGSRAFLIRNDHRLPGYPVEFIDSDTRDAIIDCLMLELGALPRGKVLFVPIDSKALSKQLARLIRCDSSIRLLVINSETSSSGDAKNFATNPDAVLAQNEYDIIISTPSLATGVSIESQDAIHKVIGIFQGVSSTDADIAQSLIRVRQPVPRVVWCAKQGHNFSKISRSTNPLTLKAQLKQRNEATVALTRSQLREDSMTALESYDWQSDPHLNLWARIEADKNRCMYSLADHLRLRLMHEGHNINQTFIDSELEDSCYAEKLKEAREYIRNVEAEEIVEAHDLTFQHVQELQRCESIAPEDQAAIAKFYIKDFYCVEAVTKELVLDDKQGQTRAQLASLEHLLFPQTALDQNVASIEGQMKWNMGNCPWDISHAELRRKAREALGLKAFINPEKEWTADELQPTAAKIRQCSSDIKAIFNLTVNDSMSDVQLVHQLLSQIGLKTEFRWENRNGKKQKVYRLNQERFAVLTRVVERRLQRRGQRKEPLDHPPLDRNIQGGGDPVLLEAPPPLELPSDLAELWLMSTDDESREALLSAARTARGVA